MKALFEVQTPGEAAEQGHPRPAPITNKARLRADDFLNRRGLAERTGSLLTAPGEPAAAPQNGQQTSQGTGTSQSRRYLEASLAQQATPTAAGVTVWRSLGPSGIPRGQTYGSGPGSRKTMAGRVAALAVDPSNPKHVLLGAAGGGIWESTTTGSRWTPRIDGAATLSIGALAFAPSKPAVVYAGTGEGNSEYAHLGQGLLRSTDGGTTWTPLAASVFAGIGFYRLVVDPHDPDRVLAATTGGAAVSTDGGATWALLHPGTTWDLSLHDVGGAPELLLAAADGLWFGPAGGPLTAVPLPGLTPPLDVDRQRMAVVHVPADPGQAYVFANDTTQARLWHRAVTGGPFTEITLPHQAVKPYVDDDLSISQAAYDWCLGAPPGSTDVVYLGAIELVRGKRTGRSWTWSDISSRASQGDSIHPDQHVLAFDPADPAVVYAGNDGGAFRSPDGGTSWTSLNPGLVISEVEYLALRPDRPDWVLAGLQDNGTIRRAAAAKPWAQVALGDGGDCATSDTAPQVCYHSYYRMYLERSDSGGDPQSWQNVTPPGTEQERCLFYPPVEALGDLVVKAGERVHLSADRGQTWDAVALPQGATGAEVSVASALSIAAPDRLLVATIRGDVLEVRRGNAGWAAPLRLGSPRAGWISDLLVLPGGRVWATLSQLPGGTVYRSDDGGTTWTDVSAGLPAISANSVVVDPQSGDRVWVATDVGVFESRDAGAHWSAFGTGLPNALAADLVLHPTARVLRVGTRSRGVWEAAIPPA